MLAPYRKDLTMRKNKLSPVDVYSAHVRVNGSLITWNTERDNAVRVNGAIISYADTQADFSRLLNSTLATAQARRI